jgi:hypothetical protein
VCPIEAILLQPADVEGYKEGPRLLPASSGSSRKSCSRFEWKRSLSKVPFRSIEARGSWGQLPFVRRIRMQCRLLFLQQHQTQVFLLSRYAQRRDYTDVKDSGRSSRRPREGIEMGVSIR